MKFIQFQIQAMQEEILYLRSHIALLQSKLASVQDNIEADEANQKINLYENLRTSPKARSNYTSDDLCETAEIFESSQNDDKQDAVRQSITRKTNKLLQQQMKGVKTTNQLYGSLSSLNGNHITQKTISNDVSKLDERLGHRRTIGEPYLSGSDVMKDIPEGQLQNEFQRMHRRAEHLRIQSNVLSINLAESKEHCEHLYLLCGKYESNAIALNQALNCSDRTIEAYDVLLALLESKLGILENAESAIESRKAAETVAKHLMTRLESEKNIQGNSLGPWQDAAALYGGSSNNTQPWTDEDDQKLREQMSKLKGQRTVIQNTVVILESPFKSDIEKTTVDNSTSSAQHDARKMDLETAVLMQELMSVREDMNEFKCRAEQAEREKNNAHERLTVMQQALLHLQAQLADSEALLAMSNKVWD